MVRNLRPLVIPAGTGNGIGIAVGAGGSAGISHAQQMRELAQPQPGRQREIPDRGVAGHLPPANPVSRLPSGANPRNPCGTGR